VILSLAFILSFAPQQPSADGLSAHLESLDLKGHADSLAVRLASPKRARAWLRSPSFLHRLRSAGEPLLDPALHLVNLPRDGELDLAEVQDLAGRILGAPRWRAPRVKSMDPQRFKSLLQEVYQDLHRALGKERERYDRRPRLQEALEQLRRSSGLEELDQMALAALRRDNEYLDTVDLVEMHRLSRKVLQAALSLARPDLLSRLRRHPTKAAQRDVRGDILWEKETSFGRFVVGGFGKNVYDCTQIAVIVDLGGDDVYQGPAGATMDARRLGVVVDIDGNDTYEAVNDGLGSATLGMGILVDFAGDDHYSARGRSAGFGAGGVGLLVDLAGDDVMELGYHSGGVGLAGVGCFIDLAGEDQHRALGQSFGLGLPGGLGLFVDGEGDDQRILGAMTVDDSRGTVELSLGFGVGVGLSGQTAGGVGLFLDARGHDTYEAGAIALGAGVQGGLGMFFDLSGDDRYRSGTGSQAMAHHFGKSLFFDGAGRDDYAVAEGFGMGAASHAGEAWFVDLGGDDVYRLGGMGLGEAHVPALAGFLDLGGADRYLKEPSYQKPWPARGPRCEIEGGLSLFLDEGEAENRYAWAGKMTPRRGQLRRNEEPDGGQPDVIVLVDR
jgi:hypothetical protein